MSQSYYRSHRLWLAAAQLCLLAVAFAPVQAQQVATTQTPVEVDAGLRARLDTMINRLEKARVEHHVPGMALAVVKDDRLICARGFGYADLDQNELVTPHTTFAIGSCTKAFTSTLVGMLVDEGKMAWDDPLSKYVPYLDFQIRTEDPDAVVTLADAMSHRTGFTRMSALLMAPEPTTEKRLRTAATAEPFDDFRKGFHYTNIMYLAAGECAVQANGDPAADWHSLVHDRFFEPLGMVSARSRYADIMADEALATPYLWKPTLEAFEAVPVRNPVGVAAAGAITANVIDMTQWIRLQLGDGMIDGTRLVSSQSHQQTWTPHIDIAPHMQYGMGWMLEKWDGRSVVQHGGNIDGFSAMTAMIPEENLGFVLLTNVSFTPLQELCRSIVWESLLGDLPGEQPAAQPGDYDDYLGEYLANFGTLQNATLTVKDHDGILAVDIPGQMLFDLKAPDDKGWWSFAMTDAIALSFNRDENGRVISLYLHQGGLNLEAPRMGVQIDPEIPLAQLEKYLGQYHSDTLDRTDTVQIQNNRLAVNIPGQMIFELNPPNDKGLWVFRATDAISASFDTDEAGHVIAMTLHQAGQEFAMPRTGDAPEPLPTVDDILKLRGSAARREAVAAAGLTHSTAKLRILTSGVQGTVESWGLGHTRARINVDLGIWGQSDSAIDGDVCADRSSFAPFQRHRGRMLEQAKLAHPHTFIGPLMDMFDSLAVIKRDELGGIPTIVVDATRGDLPAWHLHIDPRNGDVLRVDVPTVIEGVGTIGVHQQFDDYREINGLRVPFKSAVWSEPGGRTVLAVETFETNVKLDERLFRLGPVHVYD